MRGKKGEISAGERTSLLMTLPIMLFYRLTAPGIILRSYFEEKRGMVDEEEERKEIQRLDSNREEVAFPTRELSRPG